MKTTIKFGTDGWRSLVAEDFTLPNVRAVIQATAEYLKRHPAAGRPKTVLVGYDTRPLGDRFAEAVAEVLAGNGFTVWLTASPAPTPAISNGIKQHRLQGGIVVTASHNPFTYNGIKFKPFYAGPAEPEMTRWIEGRLFKGKVRQLELAEGLKQRKIRKIDLAGEYLRYLKGYVRWDLIRKSAFRIGYDGMLGAGQDLLERVLQGTRHRVVRVAYPPNPSSHHRPEPVGEHLDGLGRLVRRERCDMGLANDGDADRAGLVGSDGRFVSSQETMAILLWHLLENRRWRGRVVTTVAATNLMDDLCAHYGVELIRTPVGFKHIARLIREGGVIFGGEESGGFGFRDCAPERDGLLAGLLTLEMMVMQRKKLTDLLEGIRRSFGRWSYARADQALTRPLDPVKLKRWGEGVRRTGRLPGGAGKPAAVSAEDGVKLFFSDRGWMLLRPSGTEPLLRIYAEAPSDRRLKALLSAGRTIGRGLA